MTIQDSTNQDQDARAAAVDLLRSGEVNESEAARLAGVSRQVVHYWAKAEKIDVAAAQERRLSRLWRAKLADVKGQAKPKRKTKAETRAETEKAVANFNAKRRRKRS